MQNRKREKVVSENQIEQIIHKTVVICYKQETACELKYGIIDQKVDSRQQTVDSRQQTADSRQQTVATGQQLGEDRDQRVTSSQ